MVSANAYIKSLALTTDWQQVASAPTIVSAKLIVPSGNPSSAVNVRVNGGDTQVWAKNTAAELVGVDLSTLEFKATDTTIGNYVIVVGYTR